MYVPSRLSFQRQWDSDLNFAKKKQGENDVLSQIYEEQSNGFLQISVRLELQVHFSSESDPPTDPSRDKEGVAGLRDASRSSPSMTSALFACRARRFPELPYFCVL